jgi:hypothetical protein
MLHVRGCDRSFHRRLRGLEIKKIPEVSNPVVLGVAGQLQGHLSVSGQNAPDSVISRRFTSTLHVTLRACARASPLCLGTCSQFSSLPTIAARVVTPNLIIME